jgi:hypothetical protein
VQPQVLRALSNINSSPTFRMVKSPFASAPSHTSPKSKTDGVTLIRGPIRSAGCDVGAVGSEDACPNASAPANIKIPAAATPKYPCLLMLGSLFWLNPQPQTGRQFQSTVPSDLGGLPGTVSI